MNPIDLSGQSKYLNGVGALWAGEQQRMAMDQAADQRIKTMEDIYKQRQDMDIAKQKLPGDLAMQKADIEYKGALSKETNQRADANAQKLDRQKWNEFMDDITSMDPTLMGPERAAYFDDIRKRHKIDAEHPMFGIAIRASSDPVAWKKLQEATRISPADRMKEEGATARNTETRQSAERIAAGNNAATVQAAEIRKSQAIEVAKAKAAQASQLEKAKDWRGAAVAYAIAANNAAEAGDMQAAQQLQARSQAMLEQQQAEEIRKAQAAQQGNPQFNPGTGQIQQRGAPPTPPVSVPNVNAMPGPQTAPQQSAGVPTGPYADPAKEAAYQEWKRRNGK